MMIEVWSGPRIEGSRSKGCVCGCGLRSLVSLVSTTTKLGFSRKCDWFGGNAGAELLIVFFEGLGLGIHTFKLAFSTSSVHTLSTPLRVCTGFRFPGLDGALRLAPATFLGVLSCRCAGVEWIGCTELRGGGVRKALGKGEGKRDFRGQLCVPEHVQVSLDPYPRPFVPVLQLPILWSQKNRPCSSHRGENGQDAARAT
jgi:hypothetical protein